jgi:hypothetical protein
MVARTWGTKLYLLGSLFTAFSATAFADTGDEQINLLVEQARKQSEAGQFRSPAGDNLIETIDKIQSLLPEASLETLGGLNKDLPVLINQAATRASEILSRAMPAQRSATVASIPHASSPAAVSSAPAPTPAIILSPSPVPLSPSLAVLPPLPSPPAQPALLSDSSDTQRRTVMFKRGEEAQGIGDIAAARLWYQAAAHRSHRDAMLALGKLYDPNFLRTMPAIGTVGDPTVAQKWYQEAASLGDPQAPTLLKALALK